jgi:hypothetical protein
MRSTALAVLLLAAAARAHELKEHASEDGRYRIGIPVDWSVTPGKTEGTLRLRFSCELPDAGPVGIDVHDLALCMLTPLGQANFERERRDAPPVVKEPVPHFVVKTPEGAAHVYAYLRKAGHGLTVCFSCAAEDLDALMHEFLEIACSLAAKVERAPPEPAGYERVAKEGVVHLYGPGVARKDCRALHAEIDAQVAAFEKAHGTVVRPADEPLLVIVHKSAEEHEKYWPGTRTLPIFELNAERRIYVVPFGESDVAVRAELAKSLFRVLWMERYGSDRPVWLSEGLNHLRYAEAWTGKPLPFLHPVFLEKHEPISRAPTDVDPKRDEPYEAYGRHGFLYGFYFETGPPDARKAYAAFLSDLAETGDAKGALERRIAPLKLDPEKVQAFFEKTAKPHERE